VAPVLSREGRPRPHPHPARRTWLRGTAWVLFLMLPLRVASKNNINKQSVRPVIFNLN
jgi:hypothetical protein